MVNAFKKFIEPFKIRFEKALKSKHCAKFIMEVMLRKILVLEPIKKPTKTVMASKYNFMRILGSFGEILLKLCSSFSLFTFIKQSAWFEMFSTFIRNQQKVWFEMFPRLFEIKHTQFSVVLAYFPCHTALFQKLASAFL